MVNPETLFPVFYFPVAVSAQHHIGKSMPLLQSNSKSDAVKPIISLIYQTPATTITSPTKLQSGDANGAKAPICAFDKGALPSIERESQTRKLLNGKMGGTPLAPSSTSNVLASNNNNSINSSAPANSRNSITSETVIGGVVHKIENKNDAHDGPTKSVHQTQFTNVLSSNQAHVIQLPTAPYAPPYVNGEFIEINCASVGAISQPEKNNFVFAGIPTNVVNPIPQYNTTRPTNRVLPMQTILPKQSPPFGAAETKPVNIDDIHVIQPKDVPSPMPALMEKLDNHELAKHGKVESQDDAKPIKMDDDDDNDNDDGGGSSGSSSHTESDLCGNTTTTSPCGSDVMRSCTAEEAFDKLKNEDTAAMLNSNSFYDRVAAECDKKLSEKQRKKISRIIDNFETEFANVEVAIATAAPLISEEEASTAKQLVNDVLEQKENLNPTQTLDNVGPATKLLKIATKDSPTPKSTGPKLLYEIQSQDGFTYKSTSITEVWEKVFEAVQIARKAHGLSPLPVGPLADMCGHQMMGLKTNALKYLLEQLPGVERCTSYTPVYHKRAESTLSQASSSGYWSDFEELKESVHGTARCERYKGRSEYDMFSWLASRHRKQPIQICVPQSIENEAIPRRGSGSNLPMAMRYRTLKETYKDSVGVYRSHIHGRGLFCNRDIEAGKYCQRRNRTKETEEAN